MAMISVSNILNTLLQGLQVPTDYARYEHITESNTLTRLNEWKLTAERVLVQVQTIVNQNTSKLSLENQGSIISATAAFDGQGEWITASSRNVARDILRHFFDPSIPLLVQILSHNIKPLFQTNPHPLLHVSTSRKLARPAGGPMGSQDFYDEQSWKSSPGISNLISWCVRHIHSEKYENLWHLIIPPVMTLLDDYEPHYKLRGAHIVLEMLQNVPKEVLKRTGVDGLIRSSLNNCLAHLQNPETGPLLQAAISASLSLTLLTTVVGSSDQFDQLCALLGEGIINGIWLYASDKPDVILASLDAMPPLVKALGIGSARYLKALVSQLVHPLKPNPLNPWPVKLQISSVHLLSILIEECAPCLPRWEATIMNGLGRCWVSALDSASADSELLKMELRHTWQSLAKYSPSMIQKYQELLLSYPELFGDLFNRGDM